MTTENKITDNFLWRVFSIALAVSLIIVGSKMSSSAPETTRSMPGSQIISDNPQTLPIKWSDLGARMIESGVIDAQKFEQIYAQKNGLDDYEKELLYSENNSNIKITAENSGVILNLLWGFGLANKNTILKTGPMSDPRYKNGPGGFASTGGWPLAKDNAMAHYSMHRLVELTPEQQKLVEEISKNIYRPCCGNPTHFPDCNHGMAMLGALELMASQSLPEKEMYETALTLNSYWFPDNYMTIAEYFAKRGVRWEDIDPKEILGSAYSSAQGYAQILNEVKPQNTPQGASCGA